MADERTQITELATAAGIMLGKEHAHHDLLDVLDIPGIQDDSWRPLLLTAAEDWHRYHPILRAALANGASFREHVLRGREPNSIEWRGGSKTMWASDAPVDLRVDDVYLISAKYDSVCLLNRAPAAVFDGLLASTSGGRSPNWYEFVAPAEYLAFYERFIAALEEQMGTGEFEFPPHPRDLDRGAKVHLKYLMKPWTRSLPDGAAEAYRKLCGAVSSRTADHWQSKLDAASESSKLSMLAQMIRLCGSVYWLLGQAGDRPVRCKVADSVSLREQWRLRRFRVAAPTSPGQPRVDWAAELEPRLASGGGAVTVDGFCEIRWSHGKFQGNPECKVQLRTPVWDLPAYAEFDVTQPTLT